MKVKYCKDCQERFESEDESELFCIRHSFQHICSHCGYQDSEKLKSFAGDKICEMCYDDIVDAEAGGY